MSANAPPSVGKREDSKPRETGKIKPKTATPKQESKIKGVKLSAHMQALTVNQYAPNLENASTKSQKPNDRYKEIMAEFEKTRSFNNQKIGNMSTPKGPMFSK